MSRLAGLAAALALACVPATAQVTVGGAGRPSVEIDLGAIGGGSGAGHGAVPGYERPLLNPPVAAPRLKRPSEGAPKSETRAANAAPKAAPTKPQPAKAQARLESAAAPASVAPAPPPPFPPPPSAPMPPQTQQPASAPQAFSPAPPAALAPPPPAPPQAAAAPAAPQPRAAAPAAPAQAQRPTQTASLPTAAGELSLEFQGDGSDLNRRGEDQLRAFAARLKDTDQRIQLIAYASGGADGASKARRVSLSRALSVRSFLIDQGLRNTRIDVRALGLVRDGGPEDRVDVKVLAQ